MSHRNPTETAMTSNTPIYQLPAQSATQLPIRTMSRLECAAFLYGDEALHATWHADMAQWEAKQADPNAPDTLHWLTEAQAPWLADTRGQLQ